MSDVTGSNPPTFRGSAPFYRRGRLPYALGLPDALAKALSLDGLGRLLDVGCGPGTIALTMAGLFREVVGIDADAEMVAEAATEARRRGVNSARWSHLEAEQLPADLGSFQVATFAQSFHWMERAKVARAIMGMLDSSDGAFVQVYAYTVKGVDPGGPMPHPAPPRDRIAGLISRYLELNPHAPRHAADIQPDADDALLSEMGFLGPQIITVPDERMVVRTSDDIVASVFSLSSSTPHLFGQGLADFEAELRIILSETSPSGMFSEQTADNQLRIWRLG